MLSDGVWRSLDSRGLFKATVALSEMYNGVLSDYLTADPRLRVGTTGPETLGGPEVGDRRRRRGAAGGVLSTVGGDRGHQEHPRRRVRQRPRPAPTSREVLRLRQQATLATRPDKHVHPLAELVAGWRGRAAAHPRRRPGGVGGRVAEPQRPAAAAQRRPDRRDAHRRRPGRGRHGGRETGHVQPVERVRRGAAAAARGPVRVGRRPDALSPNGPPASALGQALLISPPDLAHTPAAFRRADGTSRFRAKDHEVYTTTALLDAEGRLLDAGRSLDGPRLRSGSRSHASADLPEAVSSCRLSSGWRSSRSPPPGGSSTCWSVPAGTGKSTTMAGLRAAWEHQHGPGSVVGLAPSATAAEVLADQLGIPTENTAKWLVENTRNTQRRDPIAELRRQLQPDPTDPTHPSRSTGNSKPCAPRWPGGRCGRVSWSSSTKRPWPARSPSTPSSDKPGAAGAKVVLVGDWAQLSPVEAGGAFQMLVRDRDPHVPELSDVRRFTHDVGTAPHRSTCAIGLPDAVDTYQAHGRVEGGDRDAMLDRLYDAWRTDIAAGKRSLMIAADNHTVTDLNQRARADRVAAGQVEPDGVPTADGAVVGVGDLVVTRHNNRRLSTGTGWVKNGDQWIVTATNPDGASPSPRRPRGSTHGQVTLPGRLRPRPSRPRLRHHRPRRPRPHRRHRPRLHHRHHHAGKCSTSPPPAAATPTGSTSTPPTTPTPTPPTHPSTSGTQPMCSARSSPPPAPTCPPPKPSPPQWADQHSLSRRLGRVPDPRRTVLRDRYDDLITHRSGLTAEQADGVRRSASYGALVAALGTRRHAASTSTRSCRTAG